MIKLKYYNQLNEYYKDKFGQRVLKICVDGGFTCPNRDGSKGVGGCIFCSAMGSGEHIKHKDVTQQVLNHLDSYRGERAEKFIVYFQNFSNTYADIDTLKRVYDSALVSEKIVGISIATRPDCITPDIVDLLKSYQDKYFVMVELGLQTADERIASTLNLGYTIEDYKNAVILLKGAGIEVVTHIILGLPNETKESITKTAELINSLGVDGVKIHNLYVVKGTIMEQMYIDGKVKDMTLDEYLEKLEYLLTLLKPNIIIHRISGDAPKDKLVSPEWNTHKKYVLNGIIKRMKQNGTYQGKLYNGNIIE